jgi:Domain of unknown function (DUF4160)
MPTFLVGEFKMRFYSNDHAPAHIHCINGDGTVVVNLYTGEVIRTKGRIKPRDSARAVELVEEHRNRLLVEWNLFDMRRKAIR